MVIATVLSFVSNKQNGTSDPDYSSGEMKRRWLLPMERYETGLWAEP